MGFTVSGTFSLYYTTVSGNSIPTHRSEVVSTSVGSTGSNSRYRLFSWLRHQVEMRYSTRLRDNSTTWRKSKPRLTSFLIGRLSRRLDSASRLLSMQLSIISYIIMILLAALSNANKWLDFVYSNRTLKQLKHYAG